MLLEYQPLFAFRIGRTGRMGMLGKVTSFARKGDEDMVSEILNLYHNSK